MTNPLDPAGMMDAVRGLPDQLLSGWATASAIPLSLRMPGRVLLLGMGGSAIAGDLAATLWARHLAVPVAISRGEPLPGWVGKDTLAVACSYSGNTAETLAAYAEAVLRGAQMAVITSGGTLAELAMRDGTPLLHLTSGRQPRAAVGEGLAFVLAALHAAGAVGDPTVGLTAASRDIASLMEQDRLGGADGPRALAEELAGRLPVIYAPAGFGAIGRRWKTQINENAKVAAYWEELPELNHNAIVGAAGPAAECATVVALHAPSAGSDIERRRDITLEILARAGWRSAIVRAPASEPVREGLWLLAFGDLVSVHLAALLGVDPSPVEAIVTLKARLAAGAYARAPEAP